MFFEAEDVKGDVNRHKEALSMFEKVVELEKSRDDQKW